MRQSILGLIITVAFSLSVVFSLPANLRAQSGRVVLWNKLGSVDEIENSEIGVGGTVAGGGFTTGLFGNAYLADFDEDNLVTFPKDVIPVYEGTIEFWAKLSGFPDTLGPGGGVPSFCNYHELPDPAANPRYGICLVGNDGLGNGGLCGVVGIYFSTGTGAAAINTYEEVLGTDWRDTWHHYALVWDSDGIAGISGEPEVAVFLDGELNSGHWDTGPGAYFEPPTNGVLGLIEIWEGYGNYGSAAMDNLIIWDYARTDFSNRFTECPFAVSGYIEVRGVGIPGAKVTLTQKGKGGRQITFTDDFGWYEFGSVNPKRKSKIEIIVPEFQ